MSAVFNLPSIVVCGGGAFADLATQVARLRATRVLLVTDVFMVKSGLASRAESDLRAKKVDVVVFSGVQADPTEQNVLDGLAQFRAARADLIVALGGGSPIDCAKAIALLTTNPPPLSRYMGRNQVPNAGAPLIAIPTTA